MASSPSDTQMDVSATKGKGFSELVVERGFCKPKHIVEVVREQNRLKHEEGVQRSLKQLLLERGLLSPTQVQEVEAVWRGAKIIAGYEILEQVGRGAMSSVFKARQIAMDRIVALKILAPKLACDATFKERFLREARFCAKLNHLHVISGIDCGEEHGCLYLAMEFVDGKTTGEMLKERGRLPIEEVVRILRQVADALQYAHNFDMVHRDVKPDNVMVDTTGTAKLCDLGVATLRRTGRADRWGDRDGDEREASATNAGRVVGTPFYLSPEQAKGAEKVDCRCDIYSLGATVYHWLTGRPPFDGRSQEVMRQHVKGEAPGVCELNTAAPIVLGQIVSKMMAKEPDERYADPVELIADLDAAVDRRPVKAAEFKGKSSCAMPQRSLHRPLMPKSNERSVPESLPALKKPRDLAKKTERATPSAPSGRSYRARRTRRPSESLTGVLVLLLAIGTGVAIYMHLSGQPVPPPPSLQTTGVTPLVRAPEQPEGTPELEPKKAPEKPVAKATPEAKAPAVRIVDLSETTGAESAVGEIVQPVTAHGEALTLLAAELMARLAARDLSKAGAVLDEFSARPAFASVRTEIEAERGDFAAAREYEIAALRSIVAARPRKALRLTESGRRKCGNKVEAMVEFFDPERGVGASLGSARIALQAWDLNPVDIVNQAERIGDPAGRVSYLIVRGHVSEARKRLPQLPIAIRDRLEKKLNVLAESEREIEAAGAFEELTRMAAAANWVGLRAALTTYEGVFGDTAVAQSNAAKMGEWKRKAEETGIPDLPR